MTFTTSWVMKSLLQTSTSLMKISNTFDTCCIESNKQEQKKRKYSKV